MTVAVRRALKIAYDGTKFSGSQRQPEVRTVDGECIFVLRKIGAIKGAKESMYQSASRTDAGVSAAGNVIAFETAMTNRALLGAFNSRARDVWAWAVASVPDDFNPRHAKRRLYRYHLSGKLDGEKADAAATLFQGRHDFRWFTRVKTGTVKTLDSVRASRKGEFICLDVEGQSFLWGMVRRIASCVESYCLGDITLRQIERTLAGEKNDFGLARPEPLVLVDVDHGLEFERVRSGKVEEEIASCLDAGRLDFARWSLIASTLDIDTSNQKSSAANREDD
jgi:tRNA pseudouridine38-40 synthase